MKEIKFIAFDKETEKIYCFKNQSGIKSTEFSEWEKAYMGNKRK